MKTFVFALVCMTSVLSFSQEKQLDIEAEKQKLSSVETEMVAVKMQIAKIEERLAAIPEGEINTEINDVLADLKGKQLLLSNRVKSIRAYIESVETKDSEK